MSDEAAASGKSREAVELEVLVCVELAFLIEMIVGGSMNGREIQQTS